MQYSRIIFNNKCILSPNIDFNIFKSTFLYEFTIFVKTKTIKDEKKITLFVYYWAVNLSVFKGSNTK